MGMKEWLFGKPENKGKLNRRELPKESFNHDDLPEREAGEYNPFANTIKYRGSKDFIMNPTSPGAVHRVHEWEHWRRHSQDGALPVLKGIISNPPVFTHYQYIGDPEEKAAYRREGMYVKDILNKNLGDYSNEPAYQLYP